MSFGDKKYDLTVKDDRTGDAIASNVYVFVYDAGTKTLSTIYSNAARVAKTNPITRTAFGNDERIVFWSASTSHDIFIADEKGNVSFVPGITPTDHTLELDRSGVDKCLVAPFGSNDTETDTGLDFPLNSLIYDVVVEVVDTDATETINVGLLSSETNGDADGLMVGGSLASAGFVRLFGVTDGATEDYISNPIKGALMGLGSAGSDAADDFGQSGGPGHIVSGSNARSLTYTCSSGTDTGTGYIYAYFKHVR